jgi:D-glycero-D-manno-heptose 1,7-bisphosphate phosphatase
MSLPPVADQRALFLDRDGVINVYHGYVNSIENFDFVDGILNLVRTACKAGYRMVVVTNQAGIERGYYSEGQFHELSAWMCAQFEKHGAPIQRVYFSLYHPTAGVGKYRKDEDTRKPGPGMTLRAKHELGLSLEDSVIVGDKPSDILAGITASAGTNVLFSDDTFVELAGLDYLPDRALKDVIPCLEGAVTTLA